MRCDVLIVGAGPAGCAAAIAARAAAPHLAVVVIDAARFPREKRCAGAITGGGLRELERARLELRVPHAVVTHATLRIGRRETRVELPRPAVVVQRLELDADLVAQARAAGATVLEDTPLLGIRDDVATTGAGELRFRAMVAADGAAGASRGALGLDPGRHALLREARASTAGQWDLLFDLDAGVRGYAWRFPCLRAGGSGETAGVYAYQREKGLGPAFAAWCGHERISTGDAARFAIRLWEPRGPVGAGRALLAGEAMGVDPLTGEGVRYALWSGRIAGAVAAEAASRRRGPSQARYRARLGASRSGLALALTSRLASRLYGEDERWRRLASERLVASVIAALVSGEPVGLGARWTLRGPDRRDT